MKTDRNGWPVVEAPEPMEPAEFEEIMTLLGQAYGKELQLPARIIAPAIGITSGDRTISRWRTGRSPIPLLVAKTLRTFRVHGRIY